MIISITLLKNSVEKYNNYKKENFTLSKKSINKGVNDAYFTFLIFVSFLFFVIELIMLYFAIFIAIYCSNSKEEKIVNFGLAVIFTGPYILLNILFNPCAKEYLKNGLKAPSKKV